MTEPKRFFDLYGASRLLSKLPPLEIGQDKLLDATAGLSFIDGIGTARPPKVEHVPKAQRAEAGMFFDT